MSAPESFAQSLDRLGGDAGQRSAALLLHAVGAADRAWLLERLDPAPRAAIDALMQDLALLGLPPDPDLIADALRASGGGAAIPPEVALAGAGAERVAALLRDEPDRLAAVVLRRPWPWRREVLRRLGPVRRQVLEAALRDDSSGVAGVRLHDALAEGLLRRLAAEDEPRPQAGWWRFFLAAMRRALTRSRASGLPGPRT